MSFDRYSQFRVGNGFNMVPFGEIPKSSTDAWLIMQANPQYGSLEYNIPDGVELRIPYPLNNAIDAYQNSIEKYNKLYN